MNKHKCDIDFEKHTPLMHLKLLVEKNYTVILVIVIHTLLFNNEWQIQHISGYKIKYKIQLFYVFKVFESEHI